MSSNNPEKRQPYSSRLYQASREPSLAGGLLRLVLKMGGPDSAARYIEQPVKPLRADKAKLLADREKRIADFENRHPQVDGYLRGIGKQTREFNVAALAEQRRTAGALQTVDMSLDSAVSGLNRSYAGESSHRHVAAEDRWPDIASLSADEVFISNRLNLPGADIGLIMDESARMLKPGGWAFIYDRDYNTAYLVDNYRKRGLNVAYYRSIYQDFAEDAVFYNEAASLGYCQSSPDINQAPKFYNPDMILILKKSVERPAAAT